LGVRAILRQSWNARPKTLAPRRVLSPRVAARNKWRRVEALLQNTAFQMLYRDARQAFQLGIHSVPFPDGTYWLKRFANVVRQGDISPCHH